MFLCLNLTWLGVCALSFEAKTKCQRALEMDTKELLVHQWGINASADSIMIKDW